MSFCVDILSARMMLHGSDPAQISYGQPRLRQPLSVITRLCMCVRGAIPSTHFPFPLPPPDLSLA